LADGLIDHEGDAVEVTTDPTGNFENWKNPAFPSAVMNPMFTHTYYLRDFLYWKRGKTGGDGGGRGRSTENDG